MITQDTIEEVKRRLIEVYNPTKIYVFGSYAWGAPHDDSDLDLLVIVEESCERPIKRCIQGHKALWGLGIAKDIIVYTRDEFEMFSLRESSLPYKVKQQGRILYARA